MEIDNKGILVSGDNSNVCRVCLTANENNQCIFGTKQNNSNTKIINLLEKLRLCSGVEILENDGLPTIVCINCIIKINDAHELRKQCQQSDTQLRELYGKLKKEYDINGYKITKDNWCQTDYSDSLNLSETETDTSAIDHKALPIINVNSNVKPIKENNIANELNCVKQDEFGNCLDKQNTHVKAESERNVTGRDAYRTRRMTMFKRVTSIENLKNHKERQRQYIRKNTGIKWDILETDHSTNAADTRSLKLYVCNKCGRHYSTKKSLGRHLITHHEKTFTCNKCSKHFFHLDKLVEHSKLHEIKEKPKPVLCRICNKSFRKTDTMVRHLNVHKRANPKEVLSILKEIRDKRKLENITESEKLIIEVENNIDEKKPEELAHNDSITSDKQDNYTLQTELKNPTSALLFLDVNASENESFDDDTVHKCKYCTKRYATEKSLQRHLLVHADKRFVCSVCNMKFYREDRLQSHKSRYGHDENNTSTEVQKPSDEKSTIKLINSWIREELDSDNEGKGFPCKICGKSYDTKKSLSKHQLNAHNSEGEESCPSCGEICNCDEKDKEQQRTNERLKPHKCNECNKSFDKEEKLQKHLMVHERPKEQQDVDFKRFLCHICSKTFRQNTGLMFHMRTHTGYKPHVCKFCGRGFASNSNRINHERTHTGDRPFVCHFCSAAFAKSCTLKAHITTHTGEANYHCKTCGKSFRRLKYLKEHRFTHTGEKPYACKICGTAYSHSGSLFVHEKKCKAQYNSYQSNSAQIMESYCQSETPSPSVTPIITILPEVHLNVSDELNSENGKTYVDNNQMITSQNMNNLNTDSSSALHGHSNSDIPDVSLTIKSFALIRQMFQS